MAIDGIATAELEGDDLAPLGVRVQLAAGADPASVGVAVEQVLASHGMRSHRAQEEVANQVAEDAAEQAESKPPSGSGPPPPPGAAASNGDASVLPMRRVIEGMIEEEPVTPELTLEPAPKFARLDSVSVEESRSGIAVRVTVGGQSVTRQVGTSPDGMDAAIFDAITELLGVEAELVAVQRGDAGPSKIVTVVVDLAGRAQHVGSALVLASDAYAVAQATWKALTAQE